MFLWPQFPLTCRYSTYYGMFHFCVADSERDWRKGSKQYRFLEKCLASVDRWKQPWLIFVAHHPLGYSSNDWFGEEGHLKSPWVGMTCRGFGKSTGLISLSMATSMPMKGHAPFTKYGWSNLIWRFLRLSMETNLRALDLWNSWAWVWHGNTRDF